MSILKIFKGKKGDAGINGLDGLGASDVNSFNVDEPLLDCFQNNVLSVNDLLSFDRTGNASFIDRYNRNKWARKPQATNFIEFANDFSQWDDTFGRWAIIGSTNDPFGGTNATEINLDVDTSSLSGNGEVIEYIVDTISTAQIVTMSFYIKIISGTVTGLDFVIGSTKYIVESPSSSYIRIVAPVWVGSGSFILSINPRGLTGARLALYGVQMEDNNTATELIITNGSPNTVNFDGDKTRQGSKGILVEESKTNLIKNSNDLSVWTVTNGSIVNYTNDDPFRHKNQNILIGFASLPNVTIENETDSIAEGIEYTVSVYAFNAGGSLESVTASLGGGDTVTFETPPVTGFKRISIKCVAGAGSTLLVTINSTALNANLLLSGFQVEENELSSYIATGDNITSRDSDLPSMLYTYNFPAPSLPWSIVFGKSELQEDSRVKTILSNGQSGATEFSLSYSDRELTVSNGGNIASFDMFDNEKVALVYDGVNVKFYGEKTLLSTQALSSTTSIAATVYVGWNGTDEYFNAKLFNVMAYNVELSLNEIIYLMGA